MQNGSNGEVAKVAFYQYSIPAICGMIGILIGAAGVWFGQPSANPKNETAITQQGCAATPSERAAAQKIRAERILAQHEEALKTLRLRSVAIGMSGNPVVQAALDSLGEVIVFYKVWYPNHIETLRTSQTDVAHELEKEILRKLHIANRMMIRLATLLKVNLEEMVMPAEYALRQLSDSLNPAAAAQGSGKKP